MKIALVSDAWSPQVNGVVTTLIELVEGLRQAGHEVLVLHTYLFETRPCPGYQGIDLAKKPYKKLHHLLTEFKPEALHIATEGPMGWAARRVAAQQNWSYTTAFHTKFPEILKAALKVPLFMGYAFMRHFHRHSKGVMVPTEGVLKMLAARGFQNLRAWTHGVDTNLFEYHPTPLEQEQLRGLERPIYLYVGRISYEKNIKAFLNVPLKGSKVVCGVGPVLQELQSSYDDVRWLGVLDRRTLAKVYAAADVFVFPSLNETFGLVMLEAMSTGTPVAAFPVDGPLQVLEKKDDAGKSLGGALDKDLTLAVEQALQIDRSQARQRALDFDWQKACHLFHSYLVQCHQPKLPV